jgi:tetratricopeptide (TPR) repeat protein
MNTSRTLLAASLFATLFLSACGTPPSAYKDKGDTYFEAGQNQVAIESYEQYLTLRAGDEAARFNVAKAYTRSNQPEKAAEHLRLLHTQSPRNPEYTEALAQALLDSGRRDELYRLLKSEALEQQTMDDWLRLGRFALRQGDKDTALVALLASAKVDGGRSWQPQVTLYDYYRSMGQRTDAIRRLRMAAWVAPMNPEVTRRMAECGEVTGPTFAMRPAEWDARAHESPVEPFNPFEKKEPATASGEPTTTPEKP